MEYISIRQIMDDILDHPMLEDIPYGTAIKYAVRFIRKMGMPKLFETKVAELHITQHSCKLPCDLQKVLHVRDKKSGILMRESESNFDITKDYTRDMVFKVQNSVLVSSKEEHDVELSYRAMNVDEEGSPMIVDNEAFIDALENYIKVRHFTILFDEGKISQGVLANAQRDYVWSKGQAKTSLQMPSLEELRNIENLMNEMIPRKHSNNAYRTLGKPEVHNL